MSTNEPIDQHYIPKVYLKAFANAQKVLYQLKKNHHKVTQTTVSKICYSPHYFTIQREETKQMHQIKDAYHIEKNAFKKQENRYEKLLKKFSVPHLSNYLISRSEAREFLDILTTIKRRNPAVRKILSANYLEYFNSDALRKDIAPGLELDKELEGTDPEEYLQKFILELNNDPKRIHDLYLTSFLGKERRVTEKVLDTLMQFKLYIHFAPIGSQFITSDNPGFTVVDDIVTNYGGLSQEFMFIFPLTPTCCLLIDASEKDDPLSLSKTIHTKHVDVSSVSLTNKSTLSVAREKVFAYGKEELKKLIVHKHAE
jgi:hypothetical protein